MESEPSNVWECSCRGRNPNCYRCDGSGICNSRDQAVGDFKNSVIESSLDSMRNRSKSIVGNKPHVGPVSTTSGKWPCYRCTSKFKLKKQLIEHLVLVHFDWEYTDEIPNAVCPECKLRYDSPGEYLNHLKYCLSQANDTSRLHQCPYCSKKSTMVGIKQHLITFHGLNNLRSLWVE